MEQPSCGRGLAERSALQEKLAELTASLADNLEAHLDALDLKDENSRREHDVYVQLARDHRSVCEELHAIARRMSASRALPMGRHDPAKMSSAKIVDGFTRFVAVESELQSLLHELLGRDRTMLAAMQKARAR